LIDKTVHLFGDKQVPSFDNTGGYTADYIKYTPDGKSYCHFRLRKILPSDNFPVTLYSIDYRSYLTDRLKYIHQHDIPFIDVVLQPMRDIRKFRKPPLSPVLYDRTVQWFISKDPANRVQERFGLPVASKDWLLYDLNRTYTTIDLARERMIRGKDAQDKRRIANIKALPPNPKLNDDLMKVDMLVLEDLYTPLKLQKYLNYAKAHRHLQNTDHDSLKLQLPFHALEVKRIMIQVEGIPNEVLLPSTTVTSLLGENDLVHGQLVSTSQYALELASPAISEMSSPTEEAGPSSRGRKSATPAVIMEVDQASPPSRDRKSPKTKPVAPASPEMSVDAGPSSRGRKSPKTKPVAPASSEMSVDISQAPTASDMSTGMVRKPRTRAVRMMTQVQEEGPELSFASMAMAEKRKQRSREDVEVTSKRNKLGGRRLMQ
jgi:hypothetical protein